MANDAKLKEKISELEELLRQKDQEIQRYRQELVRTNQSLEKVITDLTQEIRWISVIQRALTPTAIPSIPGFEFSTKFAPGSQFGGDYFDIFEHDDHLKFGVLLSCSSGYATSALFLSVLLKLSGRIEAKKGLLPLRALELVAQEMRPHMQAKDSVSIVYAVVDRRTFEFRYSSMGEVACLLQSQGQDKLVRLEPGGKSLSLDLNVKPLEHSIQLGAKDRLIICSTGVLQAATSTGESFGWDRLQAAVLRAPRRSVHDLRNEIYFQIERFTGQAEPVRDLTVLVLEVNERVIKLAK
ncbi:MAG: sigmaB regulation protein RsbU [Bdellovibrio sp.]|nr:MAG: sigmaB regulation protein RsbU [Bdellovibrio sp.]